MTDFSIWDQCQLNLETAKNIDIISESLNIIDSKSVVIRGKSSEDSNETHAHLPGQGLRSSFTITQYYIRSVTSLNNYKQKCKLIFSSLKIEFSDGNSVLKMNSLQVALEVWKLRVTIQITCCKIGKGLYHIN